LIVSTENFGLFRLKDLIVLIAQCLDKGLGREQGSHSGVFAGEVLSAGRIPD
jgi:hypothetical protein